MNAKAFHAVKAWFQGGGRLKKKQLHSLTLGIPTFVCIFPRFISTVHTYASLSNYGILNTFNFKERKVNCICILTCLIV